jgi:rhodanese-related sulfurtransferase
MSPSLFESCPPSAAGHRDVNVRELASHLETSRVRLVDVREPGEFTGELGHIRGAELIPLATVVEHARGWSPDEEVVLVCRSGNRSGRACAELAKLGHRKLMNMAGGMLAWNAASLPVDR